MCVEFPIFHRLALSLNTQISIHDHLACRLATSNPEQKNAKLGQKGSWWGHV